jgi:ribosomal protein L39E
MENRTLLCIAKGHDGDWEAICLDLDIAVQGKSFAEVQGLLNEAVSTYIEDVAKEDAATRARLLNRRVPLWVRLNYIGRFVWHALAARNRRDGLQGSFEIPCPA